MEYISVSVKCDGGDILIPLALGRGPERGSPLCGAGIHSVLVSWSPDNGGGTVGCWLCLDESEQEEELLAPVAVLALPVEWEMA